MADRWDDTFKALADVNRRRIVAALCRSPRAAGDLARMVGLAPNAVSFHLRILRSAGLLAVQRSGRSLLYRLEPRALSAWLGQIHRLFPDEAIAALSAKPERPGRRAEQPPVAAEDRGEELPSRDAETGPLPTELL